ncbi:MAG: DapH/DapD/GlmU-related protein [Promethearchaeota archaeon]
MVENQNELIESQTEDETGREEIKFQYFWYLFMLFTVYLASLVIPAIPFMAYLIFFFVPQFLDTSNFITLFTEFKPLIALLSMPLVLVVCYLIRLLLIGVITRGFWKYSQKKSPSKDGLIPRNFPSKILKYYHFRGFLMKYGKNIFTKGMFPWLSNWFYNFVGASKIGKGSTLEESPTNDKFIEVGENCYVGVNSTLASHVVEGIFGNISYFKVSLGDNSTVAAMNIIGPGSEVNNNAYLLPLASATKHSVIKGNNYYWGIPLRKIFRKKIMHYLGVTPEDLKKNENIEGYKDKKLLKKLKTEDVLLETSKELKEKNLLEADLNEGKNRKNELTEQDLAVDFTTSSAISRVNVKFLAVYLPIFWLSGMLVTIVFYTYTIYVQNWAIMALFLPMMLFIMWFIFIMASIFFSKLFLLLINLIHKPKEGIFKAEIGDSDFEFWCLRTELKKIVLWLIRNWPLPWMDILAFKWFGIKTNLYSTLWDAWCDSEFITLGRSVIIGQGATVMSSMVVGKYLLIKDVIIGDYAVIGGESTIAPGTIVGKDSVVGAISTTTYNQIIEPGWTYFGIPVIKLKENKYAKLEREIVMKKDVDEEKKFGVEYKVNFDEEKKDLE